MKNHTRRAISAIALSLAMAMSVTACGGAPAESAPQSNNSSPNSMLSEFTGDWVAAYIEEDHGYGLPKLTKDSLIMGDAEYKINGFASGEGHVFFEADYDKDHFWDMNIDTTGKVPKMSLSLNGINSSDYTFIGSYVPASMVTPVELTLDNWSDYLKIEQKVIVYDDSFGEPDTFLFSYCLTPATPGVEAVFCDFAVAYDYASHLDGSITYNYAEDSFVLEDLKPHEYSEGGSDDTHIYTDEFPADLYVPGCYIQDEEYDKDTQIMTGSVKLSSCVEITRIEGRVLLTGTPNPDDGKAALEEINAQMQKYQEIAGSTIAHEEEQETVEESVEETENDGKEARCLDFVPEDMRTAVIGRSGKYQTIYSDSYGGVDFKIEAYKTATDDPCFLIVSEDDVFTSSMAFSLYVLSRGGYDSKSLAMTDEGFYFANKTINHFYNSDGTELAGDDWPDWFKDHIDNYNADAATAAMLLVSAYEEEYGERNADGTKKYDDDKIVEYMNIGIERVFGSN